MTMVNIKYSELLAKKNGLSLNLAQAFLFVYNVIMKTNTSKIHVMEEGNIPI